MSRDPSLCIRVTNLSALLKELHLRELFECCGAIANITLSTENGERVCIIEYAEAAHTKAASFLNGTPLGDKNLNVTLLSDYLSAKAPPLPVMAAPPPLPPAQMPLMPGMPVMPQQPLAGVQPFAAAAALAAAAAAAQQPPVASGMPNGLGIVPFNAAQVAAIANSALEAHKPGSSLPNGGVGADAIGPDGMSAAAKARIDEVARTIYVGNISLSLTEDHLRAFFAPVGPIAYCKLAGDINGVRYGFVEYERLEHANIALTLTGRTLGDRAIKVGKAHNPIIKNEKGIEANNAFLAAQKSGMAGGGAAPAAPTVDKAEAARRAMEALKRLDKKVSTGVADDHSSDSKRKRSSRSRSPRRRSRSRSRSPRDRDGSRDVRDTRDGRGGYRPYDRRDNYGRGGGGYGGSGGGSGYGGGGYGGYGARGGPNDAYAEKKKNKKPAMDTTGMFWDGFQWNPLPTVPGAPTGLSAAKQEKAVRSAIYDEQHKKH